MCIRDRHQGVRADSRLADSLFWQQPSGHEGECAYLLQLPYRGRRAELQRPRVLRRRDHPTDQPRDLLQEGNREAEGRLVVEPAPLAGGWRRTVPDGAVRCPLSNPGSVSARTPLHAAITNAATRKPRARAFHVRAAWDEARRTCWRARAARRRACALEGGLLRASS